MHSNSLTSIRRILKLALLPLSHELSLSSLALALAKPHGFSQENGTNELFT
ncbi:hypothetical protein A2U01_0112209, partial [Trifolium medium]|nr:hypothetical protein [Trifolium medium]